MSCVANVGQRAPEASFLEKLFSELESTRLRYCVMRNYEMLPSSLNGSDLDLLVLFEDRDEIAAVIIEAARSCGGRLISQYVTKGRYMKFLGCCDGRWWGAAIDLMPGMDYRGRVYLDPEPLIDRAEDYNGISVSSPCDIDIVALIKELLNNGKTRKQYLPLAASAYQTYGKDSLKAAIAAFGESLAFELGDWLETTQGDSRDVSRMAIKMRRYVNLRHGSSQRGSGVTNFLRRMQRLWSPPGMSIAITGTDGAGKTTVIDNITPLLKIATHGGVHYEHLRPNWIPSLGVATGKREKSSGGPVTDPHGEKASGIVGSLVRLCYYWLDYTLGYFKKTYPRIVKKSHICLFDRYHYDIVIDPRRMRMSLPRWILDFAFTLAPRPSLIVCLGSDAKTLYQRKPETSIEEVKRQVSAYRSLALKDERAIWIDTAQDLGGTIDDVLRAIQITMANRYE
jgi:thymidylate kinase